ncbi:capsular polysaccharide transport system ATP-binding protein [Shimia isoporae]|uniref:Capsular polysaccharide transport system ATP-binding protein n=1 Tax=Shimia isoporae TaxID=647720 RepID=A0A4R1N1L5_9RHOB|nr:ABC transporter ATP-binding protein [Shimia isoporae]TCK99846.1 capsular polysaccharide transport system ATP-binding protein [Shimia isoporae]
MIRIENLCKAYHMNGRSKVVADNLNADIPSRTAVAILGRNGAGKSSLLRMIAGTMSPDSGRVISDGSISWQVGFGGSAHPQLTGLQNTRFVARVYGVDSDELVESVREFAELGEHFFLPVRSYSSGMKARLSFGLSMGIQFDTYLVDEITAVGDASFKQKSEDVFMERLEKSGLVMVSHSMQAVRRLCTEGAVIEDGKMTYYTDIQAAVDHHLENVAKRREARAMGAEGPALV